MSEHVPKPLASPKTKDESSDTPTGKFRAVQKQLKFGGVIAGLLLLGTIAGGILEMIGISKAAAQEATAPLKAETELNKMKLEFFKDEFKRHLEDESVKHSETTAAIVKSNEAIDRVDKNQQALLDAMHVPEKKRERPKKDAGE